jgi:hypothetical protein
LKEEKKQWKLIMIADFKGNMTNLTKLKFNLTILHNHRQKAQVVTSRQLLSCDLRFHQPQGTNSLNQHLP